MAEKSTAYNPAMRWYLDASEFALEDLAALQGPRGEVVARLGRTATLGTDKEKRRRAGTALCFLEDPLGIPYLQEALQDPAPQVRSEALMTLGYLGDESILPLCRRHLQEKTEMSRFAAIALGVLADGRGFPLLWSAYERNIAPTATVAGLKVLYEACMPMMGRLAIAPSVMSRQGTLEILDLVWQSRASAAVLHTLDLARDLRAQQILLKPFVLSSASELGKKIGTGLRDLLIHRVSDPTLPLDVRQVAVTQLRQLAPAEADALLAPVLKKLTGAEVAALGQARPSRLRFLRKGGKHAG